MRGDAIIEKTVRLWFWGHAMYDQAGFATVKAASVFPDKHGTNCGTAARVDHAFGLRRSVTQCDVTETGGAERFCHATPEHIHGLEQSNLRAKAKIRNNPWVGCVEQQRQSIAEISEKAGDR